MGITAKLKAKTGINNRENWGMGFLLVLLPQDNSSSSNTTAKTAGGAAAIVDKANPLSSSQLPSSSGRNSDNNNNNATRTIKRTNSNNPIISKTQSTISICVLLLLFSLLLFTLSTFETTVPNSNSLIKTPRRLLPEKPPAELKTKTQFSFFATVWRNKYQPRNNGRTRNDQLLSSPALQGMGRLYRRGTRAMSDLVVGHVVEDTSEDDFRLFLRVLHRSGLSVRADVVFIFGSSSFASRFDALIGEENDSFSKLVLRYKAFENRTNQHSAAASRFDATQFNLKHGRQVIAEPLWGKRIRVNGSNDSGETAAELTRLSYGSVVGFEASELDPENSLAGFLEQVPMSLRRWACYPMLLGRVRRNFKHVMLVDAKNSALLGDPLGRVRNRSPETVYIPSRQERSKNSRRNAEKAQSHSQANPVFLMGGARGIRRLSNAMLTEIVRVTMQHKKKSPVTESGILSQLVSSGRHVLKGINLITPSESIPDASSLSGSNSSFWNHHKIIQRGNSNHDLLNSIIMKQICSREDGSSVYRDCQSFVTAS